MSFKEGDRVSISLKPLSDTDPRTEIDAKYDSSSGLVERQILNTPRYSIRIQQDATAGLPEEESLVGKLINIREIDLQPTETAESQK